MKICVVCGDPLTGRQQSYCKPICARRAYMEARKADGRLKAYRGGSADKRAAWQRENKDRYTETRSCFRCEVEFTCSRYLDQCYCSVSCGRSIWASKLPDGHPALRVPARVWTAGYCAHCSGPFVSPRRGVKYCSVRCAVREGQGQPRQSPADIALLMQPRDCPDCGDHYTPKSTVQIYCTERCTNRVHRRTRRAREANASGDFSWIEVTKLFLRFERCCAYCETQLDRQPDPDHVVPLSRGGSNYISNILPACSACNNDKSDLTLDEWAASRIERGLSPRRTTWATEDQRFWHLQLAAPTIAAYRDRVHTVSAAA